MNLRGLLSNVRILARNPRAQQPSDRTLLFLLSRQVQNLLTEANLRGRYWAVDEFELVVTPNTADYLIPVEGFGKAIEVRSLFPGNPSYTSYNVDFFELGDLGFDWPYANDFALSGSLDGSPHSTQRIAFYHKQGNAYARVMPTPAQAASFNIIYQVSMFGETTPLDEPLLFPEHTGLIELRTAIAALPHCEWVPDAAVNAEMRKELALTLDRDEQRSYLLFKHYMATQSANNEPNYRLLSSIDE